MLPLDLSGSVVLQTWRRFLAPCILLLHTLGIRRLRRDYHNVVVPFLIACYTYKSSTDKYKEDKIY